MERQGDGFFREESSPYLFVLMQFLLVYGYAQLYNRKDVIKQIKYLWEGGNSLTPCKKSLNYN